MTAPTDPTTLTDAELDRAIIDASRALIAAARLRPRNAQAVADAQAEYDALLAIKAARA